MGCLVAPDQLEDIAELRAKRAPYLPRFSTYGRFGSLRRSESFCHCIEACLAALWPANNLMSPQVAHTTICTFAEARPKSSEIPGSKSGPNPPAAFVSPLT